MPCLASVVPLHCIRTDLGERLAADAPKDGEVAWPLRPSGLAESVRFGFGPGAQVVADLLAGLVLSAGERPSPVPFAAPRSTVPK